MKVPSFPFRWGIWRSYAFALPLLLAFFGASPARADRIDPTFNAAVAKEISSANPPRTILQPDGRLIVWNSDYFIRLLPDGAPDTSFNYCNCLMNTTNSVILQPDGKILLGGSNTTGGSRIVRLNADGSQDPTLSFDAANTSTYTYTVSVKTVQPDGKIFIDAGGTFLGVTAKYLSRLNPDGSNDASFTGILLSNSRSDITSVVEIALTPDGGFYAALRNDFASVRTSSSIIKRNADGTEDATWLAPNIGPNGFFDTSFISDIDRQLDGNLMVAGKFNTINGVAKPNLARLLEFGDLDTSFNPTATFSISEAKVFSNFKILINSQAGAGQVFLLARLNPNGSRDFAFEAPVFVSSVLPPVNVDAQGRIIFYGVSAPGQRRFFRLAPDGPIEDSFNPNLSDFGKIRDLVRQPDGSFIITGDFTLVGTIARRSIARVGPNGAADTTFNAGAGFDAIPDRIVLQADGKILAFGQFTSYDGTPRNGIARINPDGTLDGAFNPAFSSRSIRDLKLQSDQKIVVGGGFTSINGTTRNGIARLNANGSLDDTFNPIIGAGSGGGVLVNGVFAQGDGKIVIGGDFSGVNGLNRTNLARLNADGSLDQTFNAGNFPAAGKVYRQADGRYLTTNGTETWSIARVNADGSPDGTFTSPLFEANPSADPSIDAIAIRPDGSLLVGGDFVRVGSTVRRNFVRLRPTGTLDPLFFPAGTDAPVRSMAGQPDGKVVLGGDFKRFDNAPRAGNVRLSLSDFRRATPFDFDGDGRADIGVVRPANYDWFVLRSSGGVTTQNFGLPDDVLAPADYDGDGKTDLGVFRPSTGTFWKTSSLNGGFSPTQWGTNGDIPRPSDYDGDGKADFIVYRPSNGVWYRLKSDGTQSSIIPFGQPGDQPLTGDFDGDGKSDPAVFRPSNGTFWYLSSLNGGGLAIQWGTNGDVPVQADYTGDGRTDLAVFRPSNGTWYIYDLATAGVTITQFGLNGDRPVAADYDGDGKSDIAVFRPSSGVWYVQQSTGGFFAAQFGTGTDLAVPGSFVP